jgi:ATP-dependent DNA helicase RecQ
MADIDEDIEFVEDIDYEKFIAGMEFYKSTPDKVQNAVNALFGLNYLFPYQRLVVGNILEAAEAAKIPIKWPNSDESGELFPEIAKNNAASDKREENETDREGLGRQIVILPTGAGKSLCFQLPAMLLDGPTLVIYPILSLMADQERRLAEKNFAPVILRGAQTKSERAAIFEKLRTGESRFIIANPEVLLTPAIMEKLPTLGIVHTVIDEAHCVSEWGESFRPSYLEIGKIIKAANCPLVTAFTATASAPVLEKIDKYIFGAEEKEGGAGPANRIIGNPDRANIRYAAMGTLLPDLAVRDLLQKNERPAIVFCSSRNGTEKLARYLRNALNDEEICFYHAGLERAEKTSVENWFFNSANGVLIATCAYGMGVDKANIKTVIHRDCPPSVEAYLQESGRAGRDGSQSRAFLLWGPEDAAQMRRAKTDYDKKRLSDLFGYSRSIKTCRREVLLALLNYQGEGEKPPTDCCDVCDNAALDTPRERSPIEDFFRRNPRSFNIVEAGQFLPRFSGIEWTADDAKKAIRLLLSEQRLSKSKNFLWKDKISVTKPAYNAAVIL